MITRNFEVTVRLQEYNHIPICFQVVQNDKDVYGLIIKIYDGVTEIDYSQISTATITFLKKDKTEVQGDLVVGASNLTYSMGTNEIACPGDVLASIQLFGADDERLSTARFKFEVVADLINPSAIQSESNFPILQQLVADVTQLKQDIINLQVPDNSLMDTKLSDSAGQIKARFVAHLADSVTDADGAHGLKIETGTFTPFVTGASGMGTFVPAYTTQNGRYQKINNRYLFDIEIQFSSYAGTFSGAFRIGGLPAPLALQSVAGITAIEYYTFDASAKFLALTIIGATIVVNQIRDNNTVVGTTNANLGQTFRIRCFGEYLSS